MALDFDSPPMNDVIVDQKGRPTDRYSQWHSVSWQTLTDYITKNGIRLPPVTTAERDAQQSPMDGTMIYNTTLKKAQLREDGAWKTFVTV